MKTVLLITGLLLILAAPALAGHANIAWGTECWGKAAVQNNLMTFACDSNTSPVAWSFTPSFVLDTDTEVWAIDSFVEVVFESGAIPDWWRRSVSGDCNYPGMQATCAYAGGSCNDIFHGVSYGGAGYGYLTPTQVQIETIFAVDTVETFVTVPAGVETFASTVTLKNGNTVGAGACAGCATGGVLGIHHIVLDTPTSLITVPTMRDDAGNHCLVWQHGWSNHSGTQPCNPPVPTRNTTWGQVKSLYR